MTGVDRVQIRTGGRSADIRERVFRALREALAEGDPDALSIDKLSQRSGVHKATIYRRWLSTSGALADLLTELTPPQGPLPDTGELREDLKAVAVRVWLTLTSPTTNAMMHRIAGSSDDALAAAARDYWAGAFEHAGEVVRRAQARGDATPRVDPVAAIETLVAPLYLRLLVTHQPVDDVLVSDLAERTARLLEP